MRSLVFVLVPCCSVLAFAKPPVFSNLPVPEARAEAEAAGKLFILKATADWCLPCKKMDETTFVDPGVVGFIESSAVLAEFDVDEDPAMARKQRILAMPTMIAFSGGEEVGRAMGYRDAAGFLEWAGALRDGGAGMEEPTAFEKIGLGEEDEIRAKLMAAGGYVRDGEYDEATEAFVWLWDNMLGVGPAYTGVRVSFMASDMQRLARLHGPARTRFEALRDGLADRLETNPRATHDWLVLSERVLGDRAGVLAWVDGTIERERGAETLRAHLDVIEDALIDDGRYAQLGRLITDPIDHLSVSFMIFDDEVYPDRADRQIRTAIRSAREQSLVDSCGVAFAAMLAADRSDDAERVASELFERLPTEQAASGLRRAARRADALSPEIERRVEGLLADATGN
ncbi:MAG: thioredoxin family protein [Planctomycetota bacterium]